VNSLTTTVAMILNKGDEVAIAGFGKSSVSKRAARTGRNPQTTEPVKIRASKTPGFAAEATFKTAVAGRRK
jgi:DNA-binding protein HU-beta